MLKKIAIALVSLVVLLIVAAIVIPLVVDVDKYRPQIVEAANKSLNGKLELGKLKLSLWGQIRVQVGGVKLTDAAGREVVGVQDAFFHVPFLSVFTGSPVLTFKMNQPSVNVVKDKSGKMNVTTLVKETAPSEAAPAEPGKPSKGGGGGDKVEVPAIVAAARLGVELRNALVNYKDEMTDMTTELKDLNLVIKDISLSRPTELELWGDLDTKLGKTMQVKGPARIKARAETDFTGGAFQKAKITMNADMDSLAITMPGLFEKKAGIPAHVDGNFTTSPTEATIEKLEMTFHNAVVNVTGKVTNMGQKPATPDAAAPAPVVDIQIKSNEIAFKPWAELVPMLKEYELGGAASLVAGASGPSDKLNYRAKLAVKELTAKAPNLKAQPRIDGVIDVVTDQIEKMDFTMKAPGNDLRIQGKLVSFLAPKVDMTVTSSGMDLDQLIDFPPPAKTAEGKGESAPAPSAASVAPAASAAPVADVDASLAPMRANPMMAAMAATLDVDMKMIKAKGVKLTGIEGRMSFRNLAMAIERFKLGVFGGQISSTFAAALQPVVPTYQFGLNVQGLDIKEAVESQMSMFKNTVVGKANFSMNGAGSSFNADKATMNLNAKGNLKITDAAFATIDVGKVAGGAINDGLEKLAKKLPQAQGKKVNPPGRESKYESISSDFTIAGGKFSMPNFFAKAAPNDGIDIKGVTVVGLKDMSLKTEWQLIDTYNFTKAADVSVEAQGVKVPRILAEGKGPVKIPVSAGCNVAEPCFNYTEVPEYLAAVALENVGNAVGGKFKAEAKKQTDEVKKKAKKQGEKVLKGLGKKLPKGVFN